MRGGKLLSEEGEGRVKERKVQEEVILTASGGKVEANVDGGRESGDVEKGGEDIRVGGGQH